ncbi:uncharacterized protein [Lolium perenne]|uniref:uncharacterized protein n=1 Tax=Lolium perenne TaxID=4522 RepID=UPI0021EAF469|nr:uncharacterized protein LOC127314705 [Lolium perenne]
MATPTRRPARGAAIGSSAAPPLSARRVSLSNAGGGIFSQPRPSNSHLPPARLAPAALVSRGGGRARRACSCSPTTHPGSFRCALHRGSAGGGLQLHDPRRSAMANSLVRIASVEGGDHIRRALASLVRPSSHHQRRRTAFRALPSRLSAVSTTSASPSPPQ